MRMYIAKWRKHVTGLYLEYNLMFVYTHTYTEHDLCITNDFLFFFFTFLQSRSTYLLIFK